MATTLAYLLVRLGVDAKEFGTKMKTAEKTMEAVGNGMRKAGNVLTLGVTAPMLAVAGASLKMAMAAQESENLFTVAMGKMGDAARKWSEEVSDALGLNAYAVRQNVATFQQMFTAMGLSEKAAYDMSRGLTQLAYDMASFFNIAPEEAFEKLRSGIAGEGEALRRFGVVIDEATIKQVAWQSGLVKTGQELNATQKVQARYLAIMQQTANAQGDLARTIDTPTNQLRLLKEQAAETAIEFGKALIPLLEAALPSLRDFADMIRAAADALAKMDPESRKVAFGLLAVVAGAGPLLRAFDLVTRVGGGMSGALRTAAAEAVKLAKAHKTAAAAAPELVSANVNAARALERAATKAALLKAGLIGLAGAAGVAIGTAIRPWVNEVLGLNEALGLSAERNQDLLDAMISNEQVFQDQLYAYNAARKSLGLLGEEWAVAADHTAENAGQLAHLLTELEKVRAAHLAEAFAVRQATQARGDAHAQVARHMERIAQEDAALRSVTEDLKQMYGILSRQDVIDKMDALVADFTLLSRDGAGGAQLMEAFAPKVAELAEAAKGYIGLNVPDSFQQLQWVLEKGLVGWVEDLGGRLSRDIPDAAGEAKTALASSIGEAMLEAKGTVSKETENIKNILMGLADENYVIPVTIDVNTDEFLRKLKELGLTPDTVGSAP